MKFFSGSSEFIDTVGALTENLHQLTQTMFDSLPPEVAASTKIGAPNRMNQMFQTLDFETLSQGEQSPKSLTRQRGDGIKVRHIPELLKFISNGDKYDFHIWGFEEPENSLDFAAAQSEATRFKTLAMSKEIQVFMTTHSPSFYLLDGENVQQFYIIKDSSGDSKVMQGRDIQNLDPLEAMEEGFYLPAVAASLKDLAEFEARAKEAERNVERLKAELEQIARPVVLTEGRTDAMIIREAWQKRMNGPMPFEVRSCETGGENAGSGDGGAQRLAIRVKGIAHDHPHPVLALFDRDAEGIAAFGLDKNFIKVEAEGFSFKRAMHGRAYAACLPIPDFRDDCGELNNLPIEFMFPDEVLSKEHEGRSLRLKVKEASVKFGEQVIRRPLENETRYKIVTGGKDVFANQIVPNLPAEYFSAFDELFKMIDTILKFDASRHNLQANAT
jgi:hypothetical protein